MAWFRDQVNSGNNYICAKISDEVEVIDMSTVCHAADKSQNLGEVSWEPIGTNRRYQGTFDGNGKTIKNLYINANQANMGLFGSIWSSDDTNKCTIKNLTFEYADVTNTGSFTGILVGSAGYGSTLQNIKISKTCQMDGGNFTGGIAGILYAGNVYNCVNYTNVQGNESVGGLFGKYSGTGNSIIACANYGNIEGTFNVGGMAGFVDKGKIQNVFCYGNVTATNNTRRVGMVCGYSDSGSTEGMVAYYSGATLTIDSQTQETHAFGSESGSNLTEDKATGYTQKQIASGVVAYLLQQNTSSEAKWGQNLANGGDIYPVIGSGHQVYANNVTYNCKTNEVVECSSTFNNISSVIKYKHGKIDHHAAINATCTEAGTKAYWQCQDCQRIYSDSQLTVELTDVTDVEHPALGHDNNEDGYCKRCQHYVAVKPSEDNGVYLIAKPCHLAWFRDYVNGTIVDEGETAGTTHLSASAKLTADIDLKNYCHAAEDGKELLSWIPIGNDNYRWEGKMDGQGHTISNLYIKTAQDYVGLFGYTDGATIQDLIFDYAKVENVSTTGTKTYNTGILAGKAYGNSPLHIRGIKTTNNCTVIGQEDTGGIVGGAKINLENCENHSSVKGTRSVGGIAGSSTQRNIRRSTNYGTVENNNSDIGGIIGYAYDTSIEDCANYGKITSTGWSTGGIAGQTLFNGSIQNVFSYGDVTNTNDDPGIIIGYVRGTLTAKGIIAYNKEALLNNSSENIKIVGDGSLTFEDGKTEADVVKAFSKQQIKSGEVAWLLNGSTSVPAEGETLAWYQKLGENGNKYPVLTQKDGNTVYYSECTCVDKQVKIYSNTENEKFDKHDKGTETLLADGLYSSTCQRCQTNFKYIKDFCGTAGNDLELTATDGNYKAKAVTLTDKAAYNSPVDFTADEIEYTRNNPHTEWQVYYVPFDIDSRVLSDAGITAAYINNFHEYTKNGETEVVLEVNEVTSGTLKANVPYVIKAAQSGNTQIQTSNVTLHKAESNTINCQSVTHDYTFTGIYKEQSGFNQDENVTNGIFDYTLKGGLFYELIKTATLSPMRWYLTISNRNKATETPSAQPARVRSVTIKVVGEGEATGIENIHVITEGNASANQGIYDLQGRRLSAEPAHGIYIKNGKKYVK